MKLKGKTVLVTGGAKRIGAAVVQAFAEAGMEAIIHCLESFDEAQALARALPRARVVRCDFNDPESVERMFASLGRVDVLVNNASVYAPEPLAPGDGFNTRKHFTVNFFSPVILMREFARQKLAEGVIINILDQEVGQLVPTGGAYSLSRRALRDATLEAAREFAPNIRVNAVAPGPVLPPVGMEESRMEKTLRSVPLRRPVALDDLTRSVVFLAENDSITGSVLYVDCGQHIGV